MMDHFTAILANGIASGSIYALVALGIVLLQKATGIINFAHGDLVTLGAFLGLWMTTGLGMGQATTFVLVIVLMLVAGIGLERLGYAPLRRRNPLTIVISTFALGLGIRSALIIWQGTTPKGLPAPFPGTFGIFGTRLPRQDLLVVAVLLVVSGLLYVVFQRTSLGRQVRALATDREAALLQGVQVRRLSPLIFALSSALAGLAGLLVAPLLSVSPGLGFGLLLNAFAAVVLGGSEKLSGVVFAALFISVAQALLGGYVSPDYFEVYPYLILLVVLAIRPQGLVRSVTGVRY